MARASMLQGLRAAARSPRVGAVALQSFSSGLPLGLVWILLPAWLAYRGVDIKTIGLFSLAQAPWNFKFLWAPLMDRFSLPFLGRKRSWIVVTQLLLVGATLALAFEVHSPSVIVVAGLATLIAFASASQDIAIDAYAVEVLEPSEQGVAVGARIAVYRVAMYLAGALAITLGARLGWSWVLVGVALLFVPMIGVVVASPEPVEVPLPPRRLRDAVWGPLVSVFRMDRALEILSFVLLYKLGENLATALTRPFLIQKGFSAADVGVATATIGLGATLLGTFAGGLATERVGLGRALWISGVLQMAGCLGYALVDRLGGPISAGMFDSHRLAMYAAVGGEATFQGMAAGALGVLLLRLTSRSFSATQFALFSSIFALGRVVVGPLAGILVDALGWTPFFLFTVVAALPGLAMLERFAPWGSAEPTLGVGGMRPPKAPVGRPALAAFGIIGLTVGSGFAAAASALLDGARDFRKLSGAGRGIASFFRLSGGHLGALVAPHSTRDLISLAGPMSIGLACALATGALVAVRRGVR